MTIMEWLTSCDDDAMSAGSNLALIGRELIQFTDVTPLGGGLQIGAPHAWSRRHGSGDSRTRYRRSLLLDRGRFASVNCASYNEHWNRSYGTGHGWSELVSHG